jgi:hypothetical protein
MSSRGYRTLESVAYRGGGLGGRTGTGDGVIVATHEPAGGEFGTILLLIAVVLVAAMAAGYVVLRRETRRRRRNETLQ